MLPPGIFLMKTAPEGLESVHPVWDSDLQELGPWTPLGGGFPVDFLAGNSSVDSSVVVVGACETTMELASEMVQKGQLGEWGAVLCAEQFSGRGQLRRPWKSLPGNLHASIVLPSPPVQGEWAEAMPHLLPLVAGYVVAEVLEGLGASIEIKWPNDILQNGRKVGGILIEERNEVSIVGLGLNLTDCPKDVELREDHSVSAAKITIPSFSGGPVKLLENLVNRGKNVYAVMLDEIPPTRFTAMVESKLAWFGRTILVREGDDISYEAVLSGLSQNGGLVLRRGEKETVLYSGSIFPL
ncbi:biotin--[acetyl-CoA-carboxylase] ligase [Pseudodesulfovibrio sp. S3]|nr:biotin--[acetyl-CoA-carboxylase] ligase [Pseudodesulfovibrio sp. S3]